MMEAAVRPSAHDEAHAKTSRFGEPSPPIGGAVIPRPSAYQPIRHREASAAAWQRARLFLCLSSSFPAMTLGRRSMGARHFLSSLFTMNIHRRLPD